MNKKVFILKCLFDNLVVSIAMSITASILSTTWDIYTLITIPFGFVISTIFTSLVPMGKVTNWFSSLFNIKENSLLSELVGGLFTNIFITALVSFSCKLLIFKGDLSVTLTIFFQTYVVMYIVSYIVYQITNYLSKLVAIKISKKD